MKTRFLIFSAFIFIGFISRSQNQKVSFGLNAAINYGFPQIDATVLDQVGNNTGFNSLYSAGFGATIGGVVLVPFGEKTGLRTGLGLEWRNLRYASTGRFGVTDNPKEYYHNFYLLSVPAIFQIKPTEGFAIEIGPEFNLAFAQNVEESDNALPEPDILKLAVVANVGVRFRLVGNSFLGLNARWGLTPFATYEGTFGLSNQNTTNDMTYKYRGVSLTYYYVFN